MLPSNYELSYCIYILMANIEPVGFKHIRYA